MTLRGPAVSVIMPTFNRLPLTRQAIDSVIGQTFPDWELVVADDGSTDGTREYLAELRDSRIRPVFLEHSGSPARARSAAVQAARAAWVAFLDSDDLWLPEKLSRQVAQLASRAEYLWGYTGYRVIDVDGKTIEPRPSTPVRFASGWILGDMLRGEVVPSIQTTIVRRSLVEEVGGFDETVGREDFDLMLRLAARSQAWAMPEPLALIREHPKRTTRGRPVAELFGENERVFRKAAKTAPNPSLRRVCIRQCAIQLSSMASALSREGRHSAAFATLVRAVGDAPLAIPVWRAAAGCTLRALRLRS